MSTRPLTYKHKRVIDFLKSNNLVKNKTILDVGGRDGLIIDRLDGAFRKVILDIDKLEIQKSITKFKIVADASFMPFCDNCFDVVIFSEVLEHLKNPEAVIKEIARIAKIVVLTTPNNSILRKIIWRIRRKSVRFLCNLKILIFSPKIFIAKKH